VKVLGTMEYVNTGSTRGGQTRYIFHYGKTKEQVRDATYPAAQLKPILGSGGQHHKSLLAGVEYVYPYEASTNGNILWEVPAP